MTDQPKIDRFTLPRDIPDAAYWDAADRTPRAAQERARRQAEGDGEGVSPFPPAGGGDGRRVTPVTGGCESATSDTPTPNPSREREGDRRASSASHSAGRGWVPLSRDLGIPSEHESTGAPGTVVLDGVEHCFPYGVPEDVVAAIGSSEVFTLERRVRFLDHLCFKGNVRAAAALVNVSHETAYRKRRQDPKFAGLWDAALVHART